MDIVSKQISTGTKQVSRSAFALLFAEIFQYCQQRVEDAQGLEEKLKEFGHSIGWRMLNLIVLREKNKKREITAVNILKFITTTCWKTFYGKETNSLQRSTSNEYEYFIYENDPIPNQYISVPRELQGHINCASFNAGLIRGVLDAAQFPAQVRAVVPSNSDAKPGTRSTTVAYIIRFEPQVKK